MIRNLALALFFDEKMRGFLCLVVVAVAASSSLPTRYDLRKRYPACLRLSAAFAERGCNSSWAASPLGVMEDRLCIATRFKTKVRLSVEQLISCVGIPCNASKFSGLYNIQVGKQLLMGVATEQCWNYSGKVQSCRNHSCPLYNASSVYPVTPWLNKPKTEMLIEQELFSNGPVWGRMKFNSTEWERFKTYKKGSIWSCGTSIGRDVTHAVKLVGWGHRGKKKYWIAWSSAVGYVLVAREANGVLHRGTCAIQSAVWAAKPNKPDKKKH